MHRIEARRVILFPPPHPHLLPRPAHFLLPDSVNHQPWNIPIRNHGTEFTGISETFTWIEFPPAAPALTAFQVQPFRHFSGLDDKEDLSWMARPIQHYKESMLYTHTALKLDICGGPSDAAPAASAPEQTGEEVQRSARKLTLFLVCNWWNRLRLTPCPFAHTLF